MWWLNFRIKIRKYRNKPDIWYTHCLKQDKIDVLVQSGYRVRIVDWGFLGLKDTVISWDYSYDDPIDVSWIYDSWDDRVDKDINIEITVYPWEHENQIIVKRTNCNNCGAPLVGNKCEYCKTVWH